MSTEFDYDLTADQWDALKALRAGAPQCPPGRFALDQLVALDLATIDHGLPLITAKGRSVLLRGSTQLMDLAS